MNDDPTAVDAADAPVHASVAALAVELQVTPERPRSVAASWQATSRPEGVRLPVTGATGDCSGPVAGWSTEGAEEGAHVGGDQVGDLPFEEVPTAGQVGPVRHVVGALHPFAGGTCRRRSSPSQRAPRPGPTRGRPCRHCRRYTQPNSRSGECGCDLGSGRRLARLDQGAPQWMYPLGYCDVCALAGAG